MKLTDAVEAGLVAGAVTGAISSVGVFMPSVKDVHTAQPGTSSATPVRHGQLGVLLAAGAIAATIGVATGSLKAVIAVGVAVALILCFYEWLLRKDNR